MQFRMLALTQWLKPARFWGMKRRHKCLLHSVSYTAILEAE